MVRGNVNACMFAIVISWAPCVFSSGFDWSLKEKLQPSEVLTKFCEYHGYPFEVHYTYSYDGYILQTHRIPSKKRSDSKPAEAILLGHGLGSSSADFLLTGPNRSLAFILHEEGYDVWLSNSRGNTFSRNHTTLLPSQNAFWDFSWHESGLNDIAAAIDYIRNFTGHEKIFYVGYSAGATQFWVLASMKPEYNDRVKFMVAMAPVANMGHTKGLSRLFTGPVLRVKDQHEKNGYFEIFRNADITRMVLKMTCRITLTSWAPVPLCGVFMNLIGGYSEETDLVRKSYFRMPIVYKNIAEYVYFTPAGLSNKILIHYAQEIVDSGHFRLYNYSREKNMRLYNSSVPPEYPIHKITVPVLVYESVNDYLATPKDIKWFIEKLPNVVEKYTLKSKKINHFDFIFGRTTRLLVYDHLLKRLKKFSDIM